MIDTKYDIVSVQQQKQKQINNPSDNQLQISSRQNDSTIIQISHTSIQIINPEHKTIRAKSNLFIFFLSVVSIISFCFLLLKFFPFQQNQPLHQIFNPQYSQMEFGRIRPLTINLNQMNFTQQEIIKKSYYLLDSSQMLTKSFIEQKNPSISFHNFQKEISQKIAHQISSFPFNPALEDSFKRNNKQIPNSYQTQKQLNGNTASLKQSNKDLKYKIALQLTNVKENNNIRAYEIEYYYGQKQFGIGRYQEEKPICIFTEGPFSTQFQMQRYLKALQNLNYTNFHLIYVDQFSKQGYAGVESYLERQKMRLKNRITIIKNLQHLGTLANIHFWINKYCREDDIVLVLGRDQEIMGKQPLKILNSIYQFEDIWFLSSPSILRHSQNDIRPSQNLFLRSFRKKLIDSVPFQSLFDYKYDSKTFEAWPSFYTSDLNNLEDYLQFDNIGKSHKNNLNWFLIVKNENNEKCMKQVKRYDEQVGKLIGRMSQVWTIGEKAKIIQNNEDDDEKIENARIAYWIYETCNKRKKMNAQQIKQNKNQILIPDLTQPKGQMISQKQQLKKQQQIKEIGKKQSHQQFNKKGEGNQQNQRYKQPILISEHNKERPQFINETKQRFYKRTVFNQLNSGKIFGKSDQFLINLTDYIPQTTDIWKSLRKGESKSAIDPIYVLSPTDLNQLIQKIDFWRLKQDMLESISYQVLEFKQDKKDQKDFEQLEYSFFKSEQEIQKYLLGLQNNSSNLNQMNRIKDFQFVTQLFFNPSSRQVLEAQLYYFNKKYNFSHNQKEAPICIFTAQRNIFKKNQYKQYFDTIQRLNYSNYQIIYVDDNSNDDSAYKIYDFVQNSNYTRIKNRMKIIHNLQELGGLGNMYFWTQNFCNEDDIVVNIDGDDAIIGTQVFNILNSVYKDQDVWYVYSKYMDYNSLYNSSSGYGVSSPFNFNASLYRRSNMFFTSHLRTYRLKLMKAVPLYQFIQYHYNITTKLAWPTFPSLAFDTYQVYAHFELSGNKRIKFLQEYFYAYYYGEKVPTLCFITEIILDHLKASARTPLSILSSLNEKGKQIDNDRIPDHSRSIQLCEKGIKEKCFE